MTPPLLQVRDVTKLYATGGGAVRALAGVSFDVSVGEMIALCGPSGSGKTTLLDILGCLAQPSAGQYVLGGLAVHTLQDAELATLRNRSIGFVFQSFHLLPRMTVIENVELPLLYRGVPRTDRRHRAQAVLERLGLGARMLHHPNQLSGGQAQRVAIARALVTDPLLILADEPTGNLDTAASLEVMRLLQQLHRGGATVVIVTHDRDVAGYAERQLLMRDGRIVDDVQQRPTTFRPQE